MPMSNNLKSRLTGRGGVVDKILHEKSGGCKMTELVTEILAKLYKIGTDDATEFDLEELDKLLTNSPLFGVLEYSWDMKGDGTGPFRSKSFVYRKQV